MVKKHLFQYGDSQFHILQLKTPRHLQRLKCHSQAEVSEQSQGADGCTLLATRVNQKQGFSAQTVNQIYKMNCLL